MSKIFEALENARPPRDHDMRPDMVAPCPARIAGRSLVPNKFFTVSMEEEMVRLHQNLLALLPNDTHRVIQFIGSRDGEGTSTVAREFGRVSATRYNERVLLLEMDRRTDRRDVSGMGRDSTQAVVLPSQVGTTTLYVSPLRREFFQAPATANPHQPTAAWGRLREAYDLVLVDSPSASTSPEGLAVSSQVDGVILVLEADATRWPVAESVKESIQRSGGRVLGMVFNKQQFYIPQFIYSHL
jgi:Mrp family chromosome partitioning ATPase